MCAVPPRQMEQCPLPSSPAALSTWAANEVQASTKTRASPRTRNLARRWLAMACTCIWKIRRSLSRRCQMRDVNRKQRDSRSSELDLHAFRGGPDFGVVVAGVGNDLVDHRVGMVGIVVEKHQFLCA